jgi:hypothetical protein
MNEQPHPVFAPQPDVPLGQSKVGPGLAQQIETEAGFGDGPGLDRERAQPDHSSSSRP